MRRMVVGLVGMCVVVAACSLRAGPFNPEQVPADALWAVHLNCEKVWASEIGGNVKKSVETGPVKAKLDVLKLIFGLDVITDIKSVTLYGKSKGEKAVVLADGKFDTERILTLVKAGNAYEQRQYGRWTLHRITDDQKPDEKNWGTFYSEKLLVICADPQLVEKAIDVLEKKQPSAKSGATLDVKTLSDDMLMLSGTGALADSMIGQDPNAAMLKNVSGGRVGMWEKDGQLKAELVLKAKSPEIAEPIEQAANGIRAIGMLSASSRPELANLAKALTITRDGVDIRLEFAYPSNAFFNEFLKPHLDKATKGGSAGN